MNGKEAKRKRKEKMRQEGKEEGGREGRRDVRLALSAYTHKNEPFVDEDTETKGSYELPRSHS